MSQLKIEPHWQIDPDDPRAPPLEVWTALTAEQRLEVLDALPSEFHYPGEPMFAPDLIAVTDVEPNFRKAWVKAHETLGLELMVEGHKLRFLSATAAIPDPDELIGRLERTIDANAARVRELETALEAEQKARERLAAKLRELGVDPEER